MWTELFSGIWGQEPFAAARDALDVMLDGASRMTHRGLDAFWQGSDQEHVRELAAADIELNQQQRALRRLLVVDLASKEERSAVPLLVLMSITKDVERLGDYAKGLAELGVLATVRLGDDLTDEFYAMSRALDAALVELPEVVRDGDRKRAMELTWQGRKRARRYKDMIPLVGEGGYPGPACTALALGVHYHRRIEGHMLNVLSSLLMPLDKLDYFDEDVLRGFRDVAPALPSRGDADG